MRLRHASKKSDDDGGEKIFIYHEEKNANNDRLEASDSSGRLITASIALFVVGVKYRNPFPWQDLLSKSQLITEEEEEEGDHVRHTIYKRGQLILFRSSSYSDLIHDMDLVNESLLTGTFDGDELSRKCYTILLVFRLSFSLDLDHFLSLFPEEFRGDGEYKIVIPWPVLMKISAAATSTPQINHCSMKEDAINTEYEETGYLEEICCVFGIPEDSTTEIIFTMMGGDNSLVKETVESVIKILFIENRQRVQSKT